MSRRFRYSRSDFKPLPLKLNHLDITLDFRDDAVQGTNRLHITAIKPLREVTLDARDLDLHSVEWLDHGGDTRLALEYDYRKRENKLIVTLPRAVTPGESFVLETACSCTPSDIVLEGLYKDTTPDGCPQQYMSQCQQWGFQRILPIFDDCTAKCTMTTVLEADAAYTHMIANGNISREHNPGGKPVQKPGDPSRRTIRYENPVPMAPYLFLACVGTWDVLEDEVVYPSGRRFRLEYLVPPGCIDKARMPMRILKDSILWHARTQEYEYPFDVYRTICMEKSNFGGMENVGNTTIITSAALIDAFTTDRHIKYAHGVILHEFEHNQCGSEVTMETPFDMWLNEGFTVDVERQYQACQFDPDGERLDEVDSMRSPIAGPLAVEDGGHMGQIVREGFNDPDELVDGVTYVKSAEVIRMLRLIVGPEAFRKAKNLYFHRYKGGNADTDQFFACFEEVSGRDLSAFKSEWLHTIGYPKIRATRIYDVDSRCLKVVMTQDRAGQGGTFHVPVAMAALDASGKELDDTGRILELTQARQEWTFENIPEPDVVSFNRDCSFYGTFVDDSATEADRVRQIRMDSNAFNRVEAMRELTDRERIRLIDTPEETPSEAWLELYGGLLTDTTIRPGLKSYLLQIDEQSRDRSRLPQVRERYAARMALMRSLADRHLRSLIDGFEAVDTYQRGEDPKDGLDERRLKGTLLRILSEANTAETQALAERHFRSAWNITDRVAALHCLYISGHPGRYDILAETREQWKHHLNGYMCYLSIIGTGVEDDVFERIAEEEGRPEFQMAHPNHNRALYLPMSANNKILWTDPGLTWIAETVIRLSSLNESTAIRLLASLKLVNHFADDLRPRVVAALRTMRDGISSEAAPSVIGRITTYLEGTDNA